METVSDTFNNSNLLDEVSLLRLQKGRYICAGFSTQLENISREITEIVHKNFGFRCTIFNEQKCPTGISNNLIDLCLECIEMDLQKIQHPNSNCSTQTPDPQEILPILIDVSDDLKTLASYVKHAASSTCSEMQ